MNDLMEIILTGFLMALAGIPTLVTLLLFTVEAFK